MTVATVHCVVVVSLVVWFMRRLLPVDGLIWTLLLLLVVWWNAKQTDAWIVLCSIFYSKLTDGLGLPVAEVADGGQNGCYLCPYHLTRGPVKNTWLRPATCLNMQIPRQNVCGENVFPSSIKWYFSRYLSPDGSNRSAFSHFRRLVLVERGS